MKLHKYIILLLQIAMRTFQQVLSICTAGEWPPFCSVLGIIEQKGKFLLVDRTDGLGMCFPGGFLKISETPEQALIREVREETGFDVLPQKLLGAYTPKGQRIQSVILCYRCTLVGGSEKDSAEGEVCWLERGQTAEKLAAMCRPILADYEKIMP